MLTELGIDVVLRQVEPFPEQRTRLRELAGSDTIPVLQVEDGRLFRGTREIFDHLRERRPWQYEAAHRRRFAAHRDARESDVPGQLLEHFRGSGGLEAGDPAAPGQPEIVDVPDANRYELRLDGRRIGLLAYRRRDGAVALTHTEVDPSCEGRGFGSLLAEAALEDARNHGLSVRPICPFIAWYIDQHPQYRELVAEDSRPARPA